jgi:hypothetical protein
MKKLLLGTATAAFLLGTAPAVWAGDGLQRFPSVGNPGSSAQPVATEFGARAPVHHWDIRSSVQVSRKDLRDAYMASRQAYTQKLQKYAKCSAQEAQKAILAAHPGAKVAEVQLRNVRTNLVYLGVAEDGEYKYLVIVDAGNGKVLLDKPLPTSHERAFMDH